MRKVITLVAGLAVGAITAYVVAQRKEEIMKKLNEIQNAIKDLELKDKARVTMNEVVSKVKNLLQKGEELTLEEKEKMLAEIEEKLKKLEDAIRG